MLFNSPVYIFLFLPTVVVIYFLLAHRNDISHQIWLVGASLFFYGYWNPAYLWIIISSILFNFVIASKIREKPERNRRKKILLVTGIAANLGLLMYFKYTNFLLLNINLLIKGHIPTFDIVLPLAISFFTFQQIAYLVDSSRHLVKPHNLFEYCLFITFFPQLIAGPIVHHSEMMPQFTNPQSRTTNWQNVCAGVIVFSIGLFKKVVIADTFAIWADAGFDSSVSLTMTEAWAATLSYTFQLYFDFSGYCDMAIGAALLFNIHIPINFNSPYKAVNIQDFWRRWHMTLARFLRDYVYIPLGGNRVSVPLIYINLLITFLLGGIWHGAGWNFVIWGLINGVALMLHRFWVSRGYRMNRIFGWICTFLFICFSWVFFRADDLHDSLRMIKSLVDTDSLSISQPFIDELSALTHYPFTLYLQGSDATLNHSEWSILCSLMALIAVLSCQNSWEIKERLTSVNAVISWPTVIKAGILGGFTSLFLFGSSSQTFLYFNF